MKKAMISQPMQDKTREQILEERQKALEYKTCQKIGNSSVVVKAIQAKVDQLRLLFASLQELGYDVELRDDPADTTVIYVNNRGEQQQKLGRWSVISGDWLVLFPDSKCCEVYSDAAFPRYYSIVEEHIEKEPTKEQVVCVTSKPAKEPTLPFLDYRVICIPTRLVKAVQVTACLFEKVKEYLKEHGFTVSANNDNTVKPDLMSIDISRGGYCWRLFEDDYFVVASEPDKYIGDGTINYDSGACDCVDPIFIGVYSVDGFYKMYELVISQENKTPEPAEQEPSTILKQFIRNEVKKQLSECFSRLLNVD
jgi:hypothetical protein